MTLILGLLLNSYGPNDIVWTFTCSGNDILSKSNLVHCAWLQLNCEQTAVAWMAPQKSRKPQVRFQEDMICLKSHPTESPCKIFQKFGSPYHLEKNDFLSSLVITCGWRAALALTKWNKVGSVLF